MGPTPVIASRVLADRTGEEVWLKCENLQRTGSFKARGAYNRIANLSIEDRARGVVAASAGNHAQGVAWAATKLGIASTVFMPVNVPLPKLLATKAYGAQVHLIGDTVDDALVAAHEYSEQHDAVMIHPFDHADIVAGQATVGLEILKQMPDVATIVVPTGGGGLVAGIAAAVHFLAPQVRVIGVQAATAAAWPGSLAAGRPVHTAELVVSLRDFIRDVLDLDAIPVSVAIPRQGPTRPASAGGAGKGRGDGRDESRGGGGGRGGGGAGAGLGAGAGMGLGLGVAIDKDGNGDTPASGVSG